MMTMAFLAWGMLAGFFVLLLRIGAKPQPTPVKRITVVQDAQPIQEYLARFAIRS